jgi:GntR family transcriptional regulator
MIAPPSAPGAPAAPAKPAPPRPFPRSAAADGAGDAAFSPLYQQIKGLILQSLEAGEWKPGEAIPSEMDLAARFRVSQGTVRKAIDELAAENLVVRRQGKGTFVATHAEQHVRYRFLKLVPDSGDRDRGPASAHILECKRLRASADVARALGLRTGDAVVQVRRVLSFGGVPTILEDLWLPGNLQGADGRAAGGLPGPDVRAVRTRVRRAHGARRGKDPRRGPDARSRRSCWPCRRAMPLLSVERVLHVQRRPDGTAPRPLPHRHAPLPQTT